MSKQNSHVIIIIGTTRNRLGNVQKTGKLRVVILKKYAFFVHMKVFPIRRCTLKKDGGFCNFRRFRLWDLQTNVVCVLCDIQTITFASALIERDQASCSLKIKSVTVNTTCKYTCLASSAVGCKATANISVQIDAGKNTLVQEILLHVTLNNVILVI